MRFHKLQNVQIALNYLKHRQVKLVNIRNDDIADGNPKLTLGLIWTIILHFQISDIQVTGQSEDMTAKEKLLLWSQRMVEDYQGLRCDNFTTSWRDGRLFNAIIHRHRWVPWWCRVSVGSRVLTGTAVPIPLTGAAVCSPGLPCAHRGYHVNPTHRGYRVLTGDTVCSPGQPCAHRGCRLLTGAAVPIPLTRAAVPIPTHRGCRVLTGAVVPIPLTGAAVCSPGRLVYHLHERLVSIRTEYNLRLKSGAPVPAVPAVSVTSAQRRPEPDEAPLRYLQELLAWVEENQRRVATAEWGVDLPTVETHLGAHRGLHRAIEEFRAKVERARADEVRPPELGTPWSWGW
ncbi:plectin-like [Parus major]|uniref:plectin-like n=1 Tax=Parus major TaxID=9157 RepID=UPI0014442EC9|nr:plectin-like [Parus major]